MTWPIRSGCARRSTEYRQRDGFGVWTTSHAGARVYLIFGERPAASAAAALTVSFSRFVMGVAVAWFALAASYVATSWIRPLFESLPKGSESFFGEAFVLSVIITTPNMFLFSLIAFGVRKVGWANALSSIVAGVLANFAAVGLYAVLLARPLENPPENISETLMEWELDIAPVFRDWVYDAYEFTQGIVMGIGYWLVVRRQREPSCRRTFI